MTSSSLRSLLTRVVPPLLLGLGVAAWLAGRAGRPGPATALTSALWLVAAARAFVVARPSAKPPRRVLAVACVLAALGSAWPVGRPLVGALVCLSALVAFSLREALDGRRADGARTLVDSLGLGTCAALAFAAWAPAAHPTTAVLLLLAVAGAASPWLAAGARGGGAAPEARGASLGLAAALAGATGLGGSSSALLLGGGAGLLAWQAGRGFFDAPLVVGSPAQQRRSAAVRFQVGVFAPLAAVALALFASAGSSATPSLRTALLSSLVLVVVARGVVGYRTRAGRAPPLESAARLAALTECTHLAAHEIRNSLAVLFSTADLLRRERAQSERDGLLDGLVEEGDRVRDVVDQLSAFAREDAGSRVAPLRLGEVARSAARRVVSRPSWPEGTTLGLERLTGEEVVVGDPVQLEIAVMHVLEAASRGGARSVRVSSRGQGRTVALRVEGDGQAPRGLVEEAPSRLLSRAGSADAALGLAVAQRVLREHGGELQLSLTSTGGLAGELRLPTTAD